MKRGTAAPPPAKQSKTNREWVNVDMDSGDKVEWKIGTPITKPIVAISMPSEETGAAAYREESSFVVSESPKENSKIMNESNNVSFIIPDIERILFNYILSIYIMCTPPYFIFKYKYSTCIKNIYKILKF